MSKLHSEYIIGVIDDIIYKRSLNYQDKYKYDFRKVLSACLSDYTNYLKTLSMDGSTLTEIKGICTKLRKIHKSSYSGRRSTAYIQLKNLIKIFENEDGLLCEFDSDSFLYRMRVCELRRNIARKELFHIPFSQIRNVKTQRYSAPGYPCLYLARSIYCCWEEMHRPSTETTLFSVFKAKRDFDLIDLRIPTIDQYERFERFYLKFFPVIISCSIPVVKEESVYKPEYIIPQFILEWVIEKGVHIGCMGITYTSTFKTEEFFHLDYEWDNIVMPVQNISFGYDYCPILSSLFDLSKPTCGEYETMKGTFNHDGSWYNGPKRWKTGAKSKHDYYSSTFSLLEEELETRELKGIYNDN